MTLIHCLTLAVVLFAIGMVGVLTRRNLIAVMMSIELMLNAANISFISFAHFKAVDAVAGSAFPLFVMAVAAAEVAVALAIMVALHRRTRSLDVTEMADLHG